MPTLWWVCDGCGHAELVQADGGYKPGNSESCVHCPAGKKGTAHVVDCSPARVLALGAALAELLPHAEASVLDMRAEADGLSSAGKTAAAEAVLLATGAEESLTKAQKLLGLYEDGETNGRAP